MYQNITHFPGLTPLRFIAAYLVVIFHVEETRKMFGLPNLTRFSLFTHGPLAVTFFFVLSGFLITYLLLKEYEQTERVAVFRFYFRRMLRIWPLYFLMVFIGLALIPAGAKLGRVAYESPFDSLAVAPYFLLFLPFVVNLAYGNHFLTPLWSVGVEEMYYAGWSPVVKFFRRRIVPIMVAVVVLKTLLAVWVCYFSGNILAREVLRMLQFEAMAIGGLAACFVFCRHRPIHANWLFSRPVQLVVVASLVAMLFSHQLLVASSSLYATVFDHPVMSPPMLMLVFAWFIINVAVNERTILRFDWQWLNYLGGISYGIYMYHALAISLVFVPFLDEYRAAPGALGTLALHALVAALTLLFAALSKAFFEDKFLRYKRRFQSVDGGSLTNQPAHKAVESIPDALAA
jgi:peptidoglycan/LPS O-acetylase OafA/YrhL